MPEADKRDSGEIDCQLGKEIHLKHRAPVLFIAVIDKTATPLPSALETQNGRAKDPDMSGGHFVLIVSEEQFKIFSLPNLKPQNKFKLTAHEGSKVRRMALVDFHSKSDDNYKENDLVILTNQGDTQVFTIPHLRRQLKSQVIRKDNINGIVSALLTSTGEGFYPNSPSEFVRFSLSPRRVCRANCSVEIKEGVRPPPPEPEPEPEPETPAAEAEGATAEPTADAATGDATTEATEGATPDAETAVAESQEGEDSNVTTTSSRVVSSSMSRTVVTKRVVTQSSDEGTRVISSETTTVTTNDGDGGAAVETTTTTASVEGSSEAPSTQDQSLEQPVTNGVEMNGDAELPELRITEEQEGVQTTDKINVSATANGQPASEVVQEASS